MRAYIGGSCFWCGCRGFRCPDCGQPVVLRDVEGHLHMGLCDLCGPMDQICATRAAPEENIYGAQGRRDEWE